MNLFSLSSFFMLLQIEPRTLQVRGKGSTSLSYIPNSQSIISILR